MTAKQRDTSHWLWVTRREFYEDEDGEDAMSEGQGDGWWTCSPRVKAGDLALLYRTRPRSDIAFLYLATTDAFSVEGEPDAVERNWEWACEYEVLYGFVDPIPLEAIRGTESLWKWGALRCSFQGRSFPIPQEHWEALVRMALPSNPRLASFVGLEPGFSAPALIHAERELEDSLVADLSRFKRRGWDLELWRDPQTGRTGRQYVCAAVGGRIDLLCRDRGSGSLVVVELKKETASKATYTQAWGYVGWVQKYLAKDRNVKAIVVARNRDAQFEMMAEASEGKVSFVSLADLGYE